jgi:hypothetical protein
MVADLLIDFTPSNDSDLHYSVYVFFYPLNPRAKPCILGEMDSQALPYFRDVVF